MDPGAGRALEQPARCGAAGRVRRGRVPAARPPALTRPVETVARRGVDDAGAGRDAAGLGNRRLLRERAATTRRRAGRGTLGAARPVAALRRAHARRRSRCSARWSPASPSGCLGVRRVPRPGRGDAAEAARHGVWLTASCSSWSPPVRIAQGRARPRCRCRGGPFDPVALVAIVAAAIVAPLRPVSVATACRRWTRAWSSAHSRGGRRQGGARTGAARRVAGGGWGDGAGPGTRSMPSTTRCPDVRTSTSWSGSAGMRPAVEGADLVVVVGGLGERHRPERRWTRCSSGASSPASTSPTCDRRAAPRRPARHAAGGRCRCRLSACAA